MPNEGVVLLHGLSRNAKSMAKMANYFSRLGYQIVNLDYRSRHYTFENLVDQLQPSIDAFAKRDFDKLHFVGHSMGSIIAHFYIKKYHPEKLGRVVALGPPFRGSAIIDHLRCYGWYKKLHGPGALQMATTEDGICHRLGNIDYQLGVIAGTRFFFLDWFFAKYWLEHPNDGKVTVASAQIAGCQDFIALPINHTFMPNFPIVMEQTAYFIEHGHFQKN